jgi:hypothetical protein
MIALQHPPPDPRHIRYITPIPVGVACSGVWVWILRSCRSRSILVERLRIVTRTRTRTCMYHTFELIYYRKIVRAEKNVSPIFQTVDRTGAK